MKTICSIVLIALATSSYGQFDSLSFDGIERTYLVHIPASYDDSKPTPLVIGMHGGFGNATQFERQSGLSDKADQENFIVVYPEGITSPTGVTTWNAGVCCGYASATQVDDVGFINALIDKLESELNIDPNRIYATGMSNGGFMSYRLACELSDRIAAIAPIAASMTMDVCNPVRPVPIFHIHSYLDSNIPVNGGIGDGISIHYSPPLDSIFNEWSLRNNCRITNDTVEVSEKLTAILWESCDCRVDMVLIITEDGGHSWAGGVGTPLGDPPSNNISATDEMWTFFKNHDLKCKTAVTENSISSKIDVFPNPSNNSFNILGLNSKTSYTLSVFDKLGRLIIKKENSSYVDLAQEPAGIYFLLVETAKERKHSVLVKQ